MAPAFPPPLAFRRGPAFPPPLAFPASPGDGVILPARGPRLGRVPHAKKALDIRSRVSGAFMAMNYGTRPVGALAGGAAGTLLGLHPALWIAAAGGTLGFLCLLPSPMPRFRLTEPGRP